MFDDPVEIGDILLMSEKEQLAWLSSKTISLTTHGLSSGVTVIMVAWARNL